MAIILMVVAFGTILCLLRAFGAAGMYVYIGVAVIAANIQVLKAVQYPFLSQPVAMGTILFTSTFLCTDILAEYYGHKHAKRGVWIGFASMLIMTVFMVLTIGFKPLSPESANAGYGWAVANHAHITAIFTPAPALFVAGMIAYLISQFHDVWVFEGIKWLTGNKFLWLRNNVSTLLSSLVDNIIFSYLAWIVFAQDPLSWKTVWSTYIIGTFWLRAGVALMDTPIIYAARRFLPKELVEGSR